MTCGVEGGVWSTKGGVVAHEVTEPPAQKENPVTSVILSARTLQMAEPSIVEESVKATINDVIASLPNPTDLSEQARRGIIARYTSVLEGNFIYWMTGTYLSLRSEESKSIIVDNLLEEVRDSHPAMLRRFAIAARAVPTDADAMSVYKELTDVRMFVGRLSPVPLLVTMAFFEGFIQRFMSFLADLANLQGSTEQEYTEVHGVCDIAHTQGLFNALSAETRLLPSSSELGLFEGVELLRALIQRIVTPIEA